MSLAHLLRLHVDEPKAARADRHVRAFGRVEPSAYYALG